MASDGIIRLIVLRGVEGKREIHLKGERAVVGRPSAGESLDVPIERPDVLPRHAVLTREGDTYRVAAEPGARVSVNRRDVAEAVLRDGDQIAFGGALFQLWTGGLGGKPPRPYEEPESGSALADPGAPAAGGARSPRAGRSLALLLLVLVALLILVFLKGMPLAPRP